MSLTWKIILLLAVVAVGGAAVIAYKNNSAKPSNQTAETTPSVEDFSKRTYDPNAKPITDADINAVIQDASVEPTAEADESSDSALVTSDKQDLNNFDNAYVSTDF